MNKIEIRAEELQTEGLWQEVVKQLTDEQVDQLTVDRQHAPGEGSASEPVTIAVTLTVPTIALCVILSNAIKQALETHRQKMHMEKVLIAAVVAPEAVPELRKLAETHAKVAVEIKDTTASNLTGP